MQSNKVEIKRNYSRLRRGMVFWYDPNPEIDKSNVPTKLIGTREIQDNIIYGRRPWVLVSSDDACMKSKIVQVCPIHNNPKQSFPNDVLFYFKSGDSAIKCEQIRTVNADELQEYDCILDEDIMERVDICLKRLLGLKDKEVVVEKIVTSASMKQIEELIMGIVNTQVEEAKRQVADNVDVEDAVLRISEGISNLFDLSKVAPRRVAPEVEIPEPLNVPDDNIGNRVMPLKNPNHKGGRAPVVCGTKQMKNIIPVRSVGDRHNWTESEMIEFMHDFSEYNAESLMKKYGCSTFKQLRDLKYTITKKSAALT